MSRRTRSGRSGHRSAAWLIGGLIAAVPLSTGCHWNGDQTSSGMSGTNTGFTSYKDIQDQRAASLAAYQASLNRK
jgi:hypothetical protein